MNYRIVQTFLIPSFTHNARKTYENLPNFRTPESIILQVLII
uniref:Uncharacterized protein n=1 Tax=Arundo donax TaxID=35708 RepID=A0A0A9HAA3_ARUDO